MVILTATYYDEDLPRLGITGGDITTIITVKLIRSNFLHGN